MPKWRQHEVDSLDHRKFLRIPQGDRLQAFGLYVRLCDLIMARCEWDSLLTSQGQPWELEDVAVACYLDAQRAQELLQLLAKRVLIHPPSWEKGVVQVPSLIAYNDAWYRQKDRPRYEAHMARYALRGSTEKFVPTKWRRQGDRGSAVQLPIEAEESAGGSAGSPEVQRGPSTIQDNTRQEKKERSATPPPRKRLKFDSETGQVTGILEEDRRRWHLAFPGVNLDRAVAKASLHLVDHPGEYTDVSAFLRNWFARDQAELDKNGRPAGVPRETVEQPEDRTSPRWGTEPVAIKELLGPTLRKLAEPAAWEGEKRGSH